VKTCWPRTIGSLGILAILSMAVHAAEPANAQFSARVRLSVSATDGIKNAVTSCLNRELRALNDVYLVDDKPDWELNVLALEVRATRGYRGGIAISTVILTRFENEKMATLFQPADKPRGLAQTANLWEYPSHSLNIDASDRLDVMCKQIITDFDSGHLAKRRKRFRETQEIIESVDKMLEKTK